MHQYYIDFFLALLLILLSKFVYLRGNRHRVERNRRMSALTKLIVTGSPYIVLYSIMSSTTASKWEEKAMSHTWYPNNKANSHHVYRIPSITFFS